MSTITKERAELKAFITGFLSDPAHDSQSANGLTANVFRIALSSLEAKSRKLFTCSGCGAEGLDEPLESKCHCNEDGAHWVESVVYSAPPAPVSVPDEVCWEDVPEEITEDDMALASAWAHGFNQCRAAMLKHSEPFIVTSDHRMMEMPQVEAINAVTAMLQGADGTLTNEGTRNHPEDNLDMVDYSGDANEKGNSPVIPDGWVLVPEEPTHEMLEAGDEQFGTYDVYRRMIAASPQQK